MRTTMREIVETSPSKERVFNTIEDLKQHVQIGLNKIPKTISARYLYDEHGSELFNQITQHPDYYLTNAELEILHAYKNKVAALLTTEPFNLIDLGPGEGKKTEILMDEFLKSDLTFSYIPIDISISYLEILLKKFTPQYPSVPFIGLHGDYFSGLKWLQKNSKKRNVILFLGSSIGNFNPKETKQFLKQIYATLKPNDFLLLGFDLCKDINVLMQAYNDTAGITRAFNFNLLQRLNRELHADFDLNKFLHYPTYNVHTKAMESYLVSLEKQRIHIGDLKQDFVFDYMEPLHIECSYKYQQEQIETLAAEIGFRVVEHFFDKRHYFLDSLWCV
jgi:L-histidine Nalpha-methyltransferase